MPTYSVKIGSMPGGGGTVTHGQQINATNTGIVGAGISEASLTASGSVTYSTAGATVSGLKVTGTISLQGNNITLRNCVIVQGGANSYGLIIDGSGCLVENVTIRTPSSSVSMLSTIIVGGSNATVRRCDASGGENILTSNGVGALYQENYFHDCSIVSDTAGHADVAEVYNGSATFQRNRMAMGMTVDGVINAAPYSGQKVDYLRVWDNFLDGGQAHLLIDNQALYVHNVEVLRNIMGGHTGGAGYNELQNNDGRPIVTTAADLAANPDAIYWGQGADANTWGECSDLSPDRTGQVITP